MVADRRSADAGPMTTLEPSGRRAGATWVAATGAFLLLAGAAVFVAVQWDRMPVTAKLGLVVALTAAFLMGGRSLRPSLPATGDVLFHLGAFLLPVDLAALALRAGAGCGGHARSRRRPRHRRRPRAHRIGRRCRPDRRARRRRVGAAGPPPQRPPARVPCAGIAGYRPRRGVDGDRPPRGGRWDRSGR